MSSPRPQARAQPAAGVVPIAALQTDAEVLRAEDALVRVAPAVPMEVRLYRNARRRRPRVEVVWTAAGTNVACDRMPA